MRKAVLENAQKLPVTGHGCSCFLHGRPDSFSDDAFIGERDVHDTSGAMTTERWQQIETLFDEALARPVGVRDRYLQEACDDAQVRREVERLLAAVDKAETFLDTPAQVFAADLVAAEDEVPPVERIGPYRIVREIGRGGMGTVFLAERVDGAFEQRVAVKLLRSGLAAGRTVDRFLAERQILASLTHPHIARLYDGGVTENGIPYFVMEYVEGRAIDDDCEARRLSLRERLRLFVTVGRAVQHAHRRLVVHRDLKPSNIMVTEDGTPRLLDFGIAKLLSEEGEAGLTRTGMSLMTPEYASPEQVCGGPITTASDVYQLGLLLYELLTGRPAHRLATRSLAEVTHVVVEQQPMLPSTAVAKATEASLAAGVAEAQGTSRRGLQRLLRGDLDAIVMKALRKEPEDRYESVAHLVHDVERFLDGQPVTARRGTAAYRLRKFVQRHRWGVAVAGVMLVALVSFGIWHTARVTQERDRVAYYAAFLTDLFASPDPWAPEGTAADPDITVREFLSQGARRVREELPDDPRMQADLLFTIGRMNEGLGHREAARELYEEVLDRRLQLHEEASPEVVEAMRHLAWVTGDPVTADSLYRRQLELAQHIEGKVGSITARSLRAYGHLLASNGRLEQAERVLDEALAADLPDDEDRIGALLFTGQVKRSLGHLQVADSLVHEAYTVRRAVSGDDHPKTAIIMVELGSVAEDRGDIERAEAWKRRALGIFERALGPEHPYTVTALNNLALLLASQKAHDEAERLVRRVLALRRAQEGPESRHAVDATQNLATILVKQGRLREAETLFRDVYARYRETLPPDHFRIAFPLLSLSDLYVRQRSFERAASVAEEALAHLRRTLPAGHPLIAVAESRLGETLAGQERYREAEPLLLGSYEQLQEAQGVGTYRQNACERLAALYDALGRPHDVGSCGK